MSETNERNAIRRLMRSQRRALSEAERRVAASRLRDHLIRLPRFRNARNIAAYLAVQGEMPVDAIVDAAWSLGKPVYVPRLRGQHLEFHRYTPDTRMVPNRFGIPEPEVTTGSRINARFLDLVLTPLVAFDVRGGRLGTGGGFYDRTFEFLRHRRHWLRPTLLGVAYEFQKVPAIPLEPWDIPLHGVVTDAAIREFQT